MSPGGACRVGAGLRSVHYAHLSSRPRTAVRWFEAISENYMDSEGRPVRVLESVRRDFPVALHGVSMSIGSVEGVRPSYLERLKGLIGRIEPFLVSDHLCWTGGRGRNLHDLLPLPYTLEAARRVAREVGRVQDALGRGLVLENVSSYLSFRESEMSELDFLLEVSRLSGARLLLDVNNAFVNARNHGFSAEDFVDSVPAELVAQIHLAGHTDMGDYLFDTHSRAVQDPVWALYSRVIRRLPDVPVLVEWDEDIPPFEVLEGEVRKAAALWEEHHGAGVPAEALR